MLLNVLIYLALAQQTAPAAELTTAARRSRDALVGEFRLVVTSDMRVPRHALKKIDVHRARVAVWSRGNLLRTERTVLESYFDKSAPGVRTITCRNCERPGYAIRTVAGDATGRAEVGFERLDAEFERIDMWNIDWKRFGLRHGMIADYARGSADATLAELAAKGEREPQRSESGGRSCDVVSQPEVNGGRLRAWFCPELGGNPVRYEATWPGETSTVTEITYAKLPGGLGWYPEKVFHQEVSKGSELIRETVVVERADFGVVVPESTFTVAGLGLDDGQFIAYPEIKNSDKYPTLKNGKVDKEYTSGKQAVDGYLASINRGDIPAPTPDAPPPTNRPYYLASAAVFAALAVGSLIFARRQS